MSDPRLTPHLISWGGRVEVSTMKFEPQTIRLMGRLTDRMDAIRKNPHRYEVPPAVAQEMVKLAERMETLLTQVTTIKAG